MRVLCSCFPSSYPKVILAAEDSTTDKLHFKYHVNVVSLYCSCCSYLCMGIYRIFKKSFRENAYVTTSSRSVLAVSSKS